MTTLPLTPDELLTTTRTVRKRLDLTRDVPMEPGPGVPRDRAAGAVGLEPAGLALGRGAPTPAQRAAIGEVYRRAVERLPRPRPAPPAGCTPTTPSARRCSSGSGDSVRLPRRAHGPRCRCSSCRACEVRPLPAGNQAGLWGSILPAAWSFMLAARARGLGTAWTTLHLAYEDEVAGCSGCRTTSGRRCSSRPRTTPARPSGPRPRAARRGAARRPLVSARAPRQDRRAADGAITRFRSDHRSRPPGTPAREGSSRGRRRQDPYAATSACCSSLWIIVGVVVAASRGYLTVSVLKRRSSRCCWRSCCGRWSCWGSACTSERAGLGPRRRRPGRRGSSAAISQITAPLVTVCADLRPSGRSPCRPCARSAAAPSSSPRARRPGRPRRPSWPSSTATLTIVPCMGEVSGVAGGRGAGLRRRRDRFGAPSWRRRRSLAGRRRRRGPRAGRPRAACRRPRRRPSRARSGSLGARRRRRYGSIVLSNSVSIQRVWTVNGVAGRPARTPGRRRPRGGTGSTVGMPSTTNSARARRERSSACCAGRGR